MPDRARVVLDTNVLVSRLLARHSVAARAVHQAMATSQLLVSLETMRELESVLSRPKFAPYLVEADRLQFLHLLGRMAMQIDHIPAISACRDPKDDKFLALAVAGLASTILTGDHDLLVLHPFRGIAVLSPRQYVGDDVK